MFKLKLLKWCSISITLIEIKKPPEIQQSSVIAPLGGGSEINKTS